MSSKKSKFPIKRFGEYLKCDNATIKKALDLQKKKSVEGDKKRLGELLMEEGIITIDTLEAAISRQRLDRLKMCPLFSGITYTDLLKIRNLVSEVSIEKVSRSCKSLGFLNAFPDTDGIVRKATLPMKYKYEKDGYYGSFPLQILQNYLDEYIQLRVSFCIS